MIARWIRALPVGAAIIMLAGCVQITQPEPNWGANVSAPEALGALAGGALGGYLGSQFGAGSGTLAMTGLGVAAGAALGRELAQNFESDNNPPRQQVILLPQGHCLRPSSGSPATLVITPC